MKLQKGTKRLFTILMLAAAPLAYSEPISIYQEAVPAPQQARIEIRESIPKPAVRKKVQPSKKKRLPSVQGIASWYSETDPFINKHTANGEVFDDSKLTCASWHHPFNTRLKVTNLSNGKSVVCRVNDRGPAKRLNRVIDLTIGAFKKIAPARKGLIRVSVTKLSA